MNNKGGLETRKNLFKLSVLSCLIFRTHSPRSGSAEMTKESPPSPVSGEQTLSYEDVGWVWVFFFFLLFFLLHPLKSIPDKHLGIKITAEGRAVAQLKVRNLCFPSPWKSSSLKESKQSETSLIFRQLQTSQETRKRQLVLSIHTATSIT